MQELTLDSQFQLPFRVVSPFLKYNTIRRPNTVPNKPTISILNNTFRPQTAEILSNQVNQTSQLNQLAIINKSRTRPSTELSLNFSNMDYQYRKSGPLSIAASFPWNPIIQKPKPVLDPLNRLANYSAVINIITNTYGDYIDCPIYLIKKINLSNYLTDKRKALYYRALYQETSKLFQNGRYLTLNCMYKKYYEAQFLTDYTNIEKNAIYKCKNNNTKINQLYKTEYIRYSRYV